MQAAEGRGKEEHGLRRQRRRCLSFRRRHLPHQETESPMTMATAMVAEDWFLERRTDEEVSGLFVRHRWKRKEHQKHDEEQDNFRVELGDAFGQRRSLYHILMLKRYVEMRKRGAAISTARRERCVNQFVVSHCESDSSLGQFVD
ncbi:unnamed protein product [Soboliphyme baturini]|uniref:Uncharacterized protein n=1 Tax=Soboliphyme baturini TaxID=241478 RepID=A0A183IE05_9BILA|nr:unnamed protein product [Soboliphyme baturini]